ncbi:MAG: hypothetical protein HY424_01770 [Candidatus Levybacteria bacterium]|nr:hypothetical protein [Candidatus Levybacteria bacterium]
MSVEKLLATGAFASTKDLLCAIQESGKRGEKRDYLLDGEEFLRLERIKWEVFFTQPTIPDKPTLLAANHFRRKRLDRKPFVSMNTILNTRESTITTALISTEAVELTKRRIAWLIEDGIRDQALSFRLFDPSVQSAIISCYDEIPVLKTPSGMRGFRERLTGAFKEGRNIGIYPEGKTGSVLSEPNPNFKGLIKRLQESGIDFQILPIGISFGGGRYIVAFGKAIDPNGKAEEVAKKTIQGIALNLPPYMLPVRLV